MVYAQCVINADRRWQEFHHIEIEKRRYNRYARWYDPLPEG
ncbi:MAG: hypothetical protein ACP5E4_01540 [Candidatus Aenigmatarchaeota archaeon]